MNLTGLVFMTVPFLLALVWDRTHRDRGPKTLWGFGLLMIVFGGVLVAVLTNAGLIYYCGPLCAAGYDPVAIPLSALIVLLVVQGLRALRSPTWVTTLVGGIVGYGAMLPFFWIS